MPRLSEFSDSAVKTYTRSAGVAGISQAKQIDGVPPPSSRHRSRWILNPDQLVDRRVEQ